MNRRWSVVLGMLVAFPMLASCGQQPERRIGEGERDGGSASPTYRSAPRYGDAGPDAPSGGVKAGAPSANNPPAQSGEPNRK